MDDLSLAERLLEYMRLCQKFFGIKFFIIVNLRAFFSEIEVDQIYEIVKYEKLNLMTIEVCQIGQQTEGENIIILDDDYCII